MRTCSENTHRVKNLKEKQSKQPLAFVRILLLFKLWNVNHQHLTSSTSSCPLSFPLSLSLSHVSLWALSLCPHAWLTPPPPPLLSPIALHHSLAPAALPPSNFLSSCIPLFQPSLNLYHPLPLPPPLRLPLFPSFCLSLSLSVSLSRSLSLSLALSLCGSPAGHFCPARPLWENNSLWEAGGVDPVERVAVLWSRSHYQQRAREGWEGDRERGEQNGFGKMGTNIMSKLCANSGRQQKSTTFKWQERPMSALKTHITKLNFC